MMSEHTGRVRAGLAAIAVSSMLVAACSNSSAPTSPSSAGSLGDGALSSSGAQVLGKGGKGNGAPSGSHYNLNIIGVPRDKSADMIGRQGHVIFVDLHGKTKIELAEGDDFQVLDGNGCDSEGAELMLPANPFSCPDPTEDDNDGAIVDECLGEDLTFQEYEVFVRLVGKPGTGIDVATCGEGLDDEGEEVIYCSTERVVRVRDKGKPQTSNVTRELTTVLADVDDDGDLDRVGLFDDALSGYFWDWGTNGKAHAQLIFVPIPD